MAKTYYDQDVNWEVMKGKTVAIIGYGSQGHAHALNLKESGVNVVVGLYEGSKSKAAAEAHDLKVLPVAEAVKQADITMILIPDEKQADVYKEEVGPNLKPGSALAFAHGFNIHFKQIVPPAGIDVFMVAPKGPGHLVRRTFEEGSGVPAVFAVEKDETGKCFDIALAYARGLGATRSGVLQTTFRDETEEDPKEREAAAAGLNYVNLGGDVACMVNGAGLAMATVDIIKHYGGEPANFLDVGGDSEPEKIAKAFNIMLEGGQAKGIFVNIFGGINRCDNIANGIIEAAKIISKDGKSLPVPVVVRLEGTKVEEGREILKNTPISNVFPAPTMEGGAEQIVKLVAEAKA